MVKGQIQPSGYAEYRKRKVRSANSIAIRKLFHEGDWWFSIIDVIELLVGGDRPRKYWNDLKTKLFQEGYDQLSEKIVQLKMFVPNYRRNRSSYNASANHYNRDCEMN